MKMLGLLLGSLSLVLGLQSVSAQEVEGVLVLAHGNVMGHFNSKYPTDKSQCQIVREHQPIAEHPWENAICTVVDDVNRLKKALPVEVGFGMTSVESFQHGVDRLVAAGMTKLRIIPLYVSSYSGVIRGQKEIFGIQPFGGEHEHKKVVLPKVVTKVIFESALDDSMELTNALLRRAHELMMFPQSEELILVGHGPISAEDDVKWVQNFQVHNHRIQGELSKDNRIPFAGVHAITVQDDAPPPTRDAKTRALRQMVSQIIQRGNKALILPVLIAPGGIEAGILQRLRGLPHGYVGHMLTPDPEISAWIANKINRN